MRYVVDRNVGMRRMTVVEFHVYCIVWLCRDKLLPSSECRHLSLHIVLSKFSNLFLIGVSFQRLRKAQVHETLCWIFCAPNQTVCLLIIKQKNNRYGGGYTLPISCCNRSAHSLGNTVALADATRVQYFKQEAPQNNQNSVPVSPVLVIPTNAVPGDYYR